MTAGRRPDPGDGEPEDRDGRLSVADAAWRETGQIAVEGVIDGRSRQGEIDRENEPRIRGSGAHSQTAEPPDEFWPASGLDLEAGRACMTAVADEQVAAALQGGAKVQRSVAPTRRPDRVAQLRADHRRPAELLDEATGDQPDDADRPRAANDRRSRRGDGATCSGGLDRRPRVPDHLLRQIPPGEIRRLELRGKGCCLVGVAREEQPRGDHRLTHPPRCVDPRRHGETERLRVDPIQRRVRRREEGGDARARVRP